MANFHDGGLADCSSKQMADDQLRQILDGSRSMSMLDLRHVLSDQNRPHVDEKTTILRVACCPAFVESRRARTKGAGKKIAYVFYFQKQVELFVETRAIFENRLDLATIGLWFWGIA